MSTKTKTKIAKTKATKENLAALGLPALWERFKEATGETTKGPNKKFLIRRIEELAARDVEPAPSEEPQRPTRTSTRATSVPEPETTLADSTPPKARGRFASMTIEEPADEVPRGRTSYRVVKAALHKLAAEIELATPASERWCVNTEDFNESGRVYLELADATPAEAARGMALLKKLVS